MSYKGVDMKLLAGLGQFILVSEGRLKFPEIPEPIEINMLLPELKENLETYVAGLRFEVLDQNSPLDLQALAVRISSVADPDQWAIVKYTDLSRSVK